MTVTQRDTFFRCPSPEAAADQALCGGTVKAPKGHPLMPITVPGLLERQPPPAPLESQRRGGETGTDPDAGSKELDGGHAFWLNHRCRRGGLTGGGSAQRWSPLAPRVVPAWGEPGDPLRVRCAYVKTARPPRSHPTATSGAASLIDAEGGPRPPARITRRSQQAVRSASRVPTAVEPQHTSTVASAGVDVDAFRLSSEACADPECSVVDGELTDLRAFENWSSGARREVRGRLSESSPNAARRRRGLDRCVLAFCHLRSPLSATTPDATS